MPAQTVSRSVETADETRTQTHFAIVPTGPARREPTAEQRMWALLSGSRCPGTHAVWRGTRPVRRDRQLRLSRGASLARLAVAESVTGSWRVRLSWAYTLCIV